MSATIKRATSALFTKKGVQFDSNIRVRTYHNNNDPIMVTYDSGADGNYVSEYNRLKAGMPILRKSTKRVGVANTGTCQGKRTSKLPLSYLSKSVGRRYLWTRNWTPVEDWRDPLSEPVQGPSRGNFKNEKD